MWTKSVCSQHETSCDHNTRCFSAEETCDGMTKCADGADEKDCKVCRLGEQKCDLGRNCFSVIETCDGVWKCADGTDEENCNQRNCSASMFCNPRYNCTGKDSRQNCSTLNLDGIRKFCSVTSPLSVTYIYIHLILNDTLYYAVVVLHMFT